jgi:hypothetical protein
MSKRTGVVALLAFAIALGGVVGAQGQGRGPGHHMMCDGCEMMGGGMGMMGMGCPMTAFGGELKVQKLENGASISMTSSDPKEVARIQKRAEILRLVHELRREEP